MRITDIEVIPLVKKLEVPFEGGTYRIVNRYTLVTRVVTSDGTIGETFGGDEDINQNKIVDVINRFFKPALIGENVLNYEKLWNKLFSIANQVDIGNRSLHSLDMSNHGVIMEGLSAVDIAVWDTIGKIVGQSVCTLLGGYRKDMPIIAIGGYYKIGKTLEDLIYEIEDYKSQGLKGVKFKVGRLSVEEDARRVRATREAVGEDFEIICDANQAWTVTEAIKFGKLVKDLRIRWLEEPIRWFDQLEGLRAVRMATGIDVAAGQGEISKFGCRDLLDTESVDILNTDSTLVGGVTEWMKVAHLAEAKHVSMAHHEEPQVALHLLCAISHGLFVEIFPDPQRDPLWRELPKETYSVKDGMMQLPDGPGFGLKLNEMVIERYRLEGPKNS